MNRLFSSVMLVAVLCCALSAPLRAEEKSIVPPKAWQQAHQAGQTALENDRFNNAETAFLTALMEAQKLHDANAPGSTSLLARSYNDIGVVYQAQGKLDKAEAVFEKALILYRDMFAFGEMHPYLKTVLVNLAGVYQEQGRFDDIEALFSSYMPMQKIALGESQTELAVSVYELANRFMLKGRYEEATRLYQKLLSWMPVKPEAGNALYALRPDILRRLSDMGYPVADYATEVAVRVEKQAPKTDAFPGSKMQPLTTAETSPLPSDKVFQDFLLGLDQQIKRHWAPPEYYLHVPVTVLMVLNTKGELMEYHLKETSGFHPAETAALEAVQKASIFTPLPKQYKREHLVVEFNFN